MTKINNVGKKRANNGQHVQLMTNLLVAIPQEAAEKWGFATQRAVFATAANAEIACYKPFRGYTDTLEVEQSDNKRDGYNLMYRAIAKAYADYCPDATLQNMGRKIFFVFEESKNVAYMEYSAETATLTQLVEKLRQEPFVSALKALGIEKAPDEIEAANQEFNEIYTKRSTEEYARNTTAKMKELRPVSDEAFDKLAEAINVLFAANEIVGNDETKREELLTVIDAANVHLLRFQKTVNGSAAGTGEETETPDTETPDEENPGTEPENPDGGDGGDEENPSGPGIPNP